MMTRLFKLCLLVATLLCLSGCVTKGNERVGKLASGADSDTGLNKNMSKADVESLFGTAQSDILFPDQHQIWIYSYQKATPGVQNYLPELRMFFGQQNNYNKELVVLFDPQGRVKKWRINENVLKEGTGIFTAEIAELAEEK